MDEIYRASETVTIYWNNSATFEVRANGKAIEAFTQYDIVDWQDAYEAAQDWWTGYGIHYIQN